MDSRLQSYLDGDLSLDDLPPELRVRAEAWEGLLADIRATAPAGAPLGLDARVLASLDEGGPSRAGWLAWLLRPRMVPVRPAAVLAGAAAIVLALIALPDRGGDTGSRVYVQFVVDAPAAETVHLVGDFTEWQPTVELEDPDGDGVWSGRVPLLPAIKIIQVGRGKSTAFRGLTRLLPGQVRPTGEIFWVTDPNASSFQDDGFGQRNAIVAVSGLDGT